MHARIRNISKIRLCAALILSPAIGLFVSYLVLIIPVMPYTSTESFLRAMFSFMLIAGIIAYPITIFYGFFVVLILESSTIFSTFQKYCIYVGLGGIPSILISMLVGLEHVIGVLYLIMCGVLIALTTALIMNAKQT